MSLLLARPQTYKGVVSFQYVSLSSLHTSSTKHVVFGAKPKASSSSEKIDPVLGYRPSNKAIWRDCDLAKIVVTQTKLHDPRQTPPAKDPKDPLTLPEHFQWGIGGNKELQDFLFDKLPRVSSRCGILPTLDPSRVSRELFEREWPELSTAHSFSRLVDLRNANGPGIAFENRRRCVEAFSSPEKPNDTGSPEVQAALLTVKIRRLRIHLRRNKRDIANKLSLQKLVHARAKILNYLKRLDRARFETVMSRLGMEEGAIEGELIIPSSHTRK